MLFFHFSPCFLVFRRVEKAQTAMHAPEKYVDGVRMVAGCVPFRVDPAAGVQVLMITSSKNPSVLVVPKGKRVCVFALNNALINMIHDVVSLEFEAGRIIPITSLAIPFVVFSSFIILLLAAIHLDLSNESFDALCRWSERWRG